MKNIGTIVTIAIFLIGVVAGWGQLQAKTTTNEKKVDKLEDRVEVLKEKSDKIEVKQEYIASKTDNIDKKIDTLTDLILKQERRNVERADSR